MYFWNQHQQKTQKISVLIHKINFSNLLKFIPKNVAIHCGQSGEILWFDAISREPQRDSLTSSLRNKTQSFLNGAEIVVNYYSTFKAQKNR